jgi:anti-sigma regulatory factor (Ser/Thr protein kinase)
VNAQPLRRVDRCGVAPAPRFRHHGDMGNGERWAAWWRRARRRAPTAPWRFCIERERAAVGKLNDAIGQTLRAQIPESALRALQVALDELLTNVIMHAEQAAGPIEIEITQAQNSLDTTISYVAKEFDPTVWKPAAGSASVATARIGGLGIVLVRSLMDDFRYAYADGRNIVSLSKRC